MSETIPLWGPANEKCPYARRAKDRVVRQTLQVVETTRAEPNAADGRFSFAGHVAL